MRVENGVRWLAILAVLLGLFACATAPPVNNDLLLAPTEEQMQLRNMQTRSFDVADRNQALRGVIAALQDLGFIIERANEPLGLVTGARFAEPRWFDVVGVTVTVREQPDGKMLFRANAIFNNAPVTDPKVYQNFFATLERSLFIGRN
jgi:predicted RNA-binding protein (virulence factor B family)